MGKSHKYHKSTNLNNLRFIDNKILNDATFIDYLQRLTKVCLSIFEWVNLPNSMDARKLEKDLFLNGSATLLYDNNFGFINTACSSSGTLNIYGLPTSFNCYAYSYNVFRKLYSRYSFKFSR